MIPLPSQIAAFVDGMGRLRPPWNSYLQQFTQAPPNIMIVDVGPSPFEYLAKEPGNLAIVDGVITFIILRRGTEVTNLTGMKIVPVSIDDVVEVTYTGLPTVKFIPAYGQNTSNG